MWIWIIVTLLLLTTIGFLLVVVYRMTEQIEQFEEYAEWFEKWQKEFVTTLADADKKMKELDRRGTFSSDDEIGFAYNVINECIENLNQMGVITYGGQEGQTDSTETIQG